MGLVKGPFTVTWGQNSITDVEEMEFEYEVESNDYKTIDGRTFKVDGAIKASVGLTLLSTDIASLAVLLPQYFKRKDETLSTGERVTDEAGAIDFEAAKCGSSSQKYNLDIKTDCSKETLRLVNAKPSLTNIEYADNSVRKITITYNAEPEQGKAVMQFFKNSGIQA